MLTAHRMIIKLEAAKNGLSFRQMQKMHIYFFITQSRPNLESKLLSCQQLQ
jgi:hypothetical protein